MPRPIPQIPQGQTHIWPIRVYFEDTDAGGVVYYANYLKFAERARTEILRAAGFDHRALADTYGRQIVVRSCACDFMLPARLDDALEVRSQLVMIRGASFTIRQDIFRSEELLARLDVRLACVDPHLRPAPLPPALRQALEPHKSHKAI
jgi:acyl-CoA thioester hydrolase